MQNTIHGFLYRSGVVFCMLVVFVLLPFLCFLSKLFKILRKNVASRHVRDQTLNISLSYALVFVHVLCFPQSCSKCLGKTQPQEKLEAKHLPLLSYVMTIQQVAFTFSDPRGLRLCSFLKFYHFLLLYFYIDPGLSY